MDSEPAVETFSQLRDIRDSAAYLIRAAYRRVNEMFDARVAGHGLTRAQFMLLWTICLAPGLEQSEIAEFAAFDNATAGGIISRLEALGHVSRARSGRSRRGRAVHPTEKGEALMRAANMQAPPQSQAILANLSQVEQQQFLRLITKMLGVRNSHST